MERIGNKFFVEVYLVSSEYFVDDTPLGHLFNWMALEGTHTPNSHLRGRRLKPTYHRLAALAIL